MSEQLTMDLTPPPARKRRTGRELAEDGMARTLEAEREAWIAAALVALRSFTTLAGWSEFKTEDFRAWALQNGLGEPHDHHVWGALTNMATRQNIIRWTKRYAPSVSPKTHGHPVKVWTRA